MNLDILRSRIEAADRAAQEAAKNERWVADSYHLYTERGVYLGHCEGILQAVRKVEQHNRELDARLAAMRERVEMRSNARLIAAAPDLLAALEGVVKIADRKTAEFDAARAAIKRATEG